MKIKCEIDCWLMRSIFNMFWDFTRRFLVFNCEFSQVTNKRFYKNQINFETSDYLILKENIFMDKKVKSRCTAYIFIFLFNISFNNIFVWWERWVLVLKYNSLKAWSQQYQPDLIRFETRTFLQSPQYNLLENNRHWLSRPMILL